MKRRASLAVLLVLALFLPGCAMFMPNTAEVLAPHGFEDFFIAIAADVELLIELVREYGWMGLLL